MDFLLLLFYFLFLSNQVSWFFWCFVFFFFLRSSSCFFLVRCSNWFNIYLFGCSFDKIFYRFITFRVIFWDFCNFLNSLFSFSIFRLISSSFFFIFRKWNAFKFMNFLPSHTVGFSIIEIDKLSIFLFSAVSAISSFESIISLVIVNYNSIVDSWCDFNLTESGCSKFLWWISILRISPELSFFCFPDVAFKPSSTFFVKIPHDEVRATISSLWCYFWFNSFWFSYFWFSCFWFSCFWFGCFWFIDSFSNVLFLLLIFLFLRFSLFRLFSSFYLFFCRIYFLALTYTLLCNTRKGIFTKYSILTCCSAFDIFLYEVFASDHLFPGATFFTIYDIASTFTFASFISTFFIFWSCWLFFILLWFSCFWFFCCFVVICWLSLTTLLCCYGCTFGDLFFNSIKLISIRIHFFCHFIKFIFVNFFCFYYFFRFFFNGFVFQFCNFVFDFFRFSFTGYFLLFFNLFLFYILDFFDNSFFIEHLDSFLTVSFYNGLFFILFSLFYLLFFFSNLCDNFVSLCDSIICLLFDLVNILLNFLLNLLKFLLSLCLFNWCLCFFDCFFLLLNFFFGLFKLFDGNFGNFFFGIFSSFLDLFSLFLFFLVLFYLFIHQFLDFGLSLFWIFFTRNFIIVRFFSIPSLIIWYANWFCNFVIFVLFNNFVQDVLSFDLLIKFFYHLFDCSLFIFSISFFWFFWFLKWFTNILWIGVLTNHSDAFLNSLFSCLSWVRSWWLFW